MELAAKVPLVDARPKRNTRTGYSRRRAVYSANIAYPNLGAPLRILEGRLIRFGIQARF